ncbi:MAG TPA: hypothetical protein VFJ16_31210 [Longimicrobium sp.]|nr:hypothetical protein [Longimicrobium sp.]
MIPAMIVDTQGATKPQPPATPAVYATMLLALQEVARSMGYALAVHGSMARDFDLIAVPWTGEAAPAGRLADAVRERIGGFFSESDHNPREQPHGRRSWVIHLGCGCYIDLNVTPRKLVPARCPWVLPHAPGSLRDCTCAASNRPPTQQDG